MDSVRIGSHILQPNRQLLLDGERLAIGPRALAIVSMLAQAAGEIVTKDELLHAIWSGVVVEENALQVHVAALRKALGEDADKLETIRGIGYRLDCDGPAPPIPAPPLATVGDHASRSSRRFAFPLLASVAALLLAALAWTGGLADRLLGKEQPHALLVTPFVPGTPSDPEEASIAKGISDELIVRLRWTTPLQVGTLAAGSAPEGGTFADAYRLTGSVRSAADTIRVTARLADSTGHIVWSDSFDRQAIDLLKVQERVADAIAHAMSVSLDVGVDSRAYGGTDNPQAFAVYQDGQFQRSRGEGSAELIGTFQRAIELDPGYVKAWAELSYVNGIALYETRSPAEIVRFEAGQDAASRKALELKPDLWIGQAARAWYNVAHRNFIEADRLVARAQERDRGNDPYLRDTLANYAGQLGRMEAALSMHQSMADIDPIYRDNPLIAPDFIAAGRLDEARSMFAQLEQRGQPARGFMAIMEFWTELLAGNREAAAAVARRAGLEEPYASFGPQGFGNGMPPPGDDAVLEEWATAAWDAGGRGRIANFAVAAGWSGDPERALALLRLAYRRPGIGSYNMLWLPMLADTRKLPGFADFLESQGIVAAWRASGDWGDYCRPVSETEIACR